MYRLLLLACVSLTGGLFGQSPISMQASARKTRTVVGEGILVDLRLSLSTDLDMETVELNRDRTTVQIRREDAPGDTRILSGKDYIALHHVQPLGQIGRSFHGKAGASWKSELNLFSYTYPLAAGRYRVLVSYRYGSEPSSVAQANEVEIEVAPAKLLYAEFRWFGGATAREELGALWSAEDAGHTRWFYQVSDAADPAAVRSAVELAGPVPESAPRMAQLNDIVDNHFVRFAVWLVTGRVCWQKIADTGAGGRPNCADVGLQPGGALHLADPPLQTRDDGLSAVVVGGDKLSVVRIGANGQAEHRLVPTGGATAGEAVVVWGQSEQPPQGTVYGAVGDQVWKVDLVSGRRDILWHSPNQVTLMADQWLGQGKVYAASRVGDTVEFRTGAPAAAPPVNISFPRTWKLVGATSLAAGQGLALTAATPDGWAIVTSRSRWMGTSGIPHVIAAPKGLFLLQYDSLHGFSVIRRQ
ncbi:MAG TPA: hypothetical protein VGL72_26610 [Bryobacteraceae bacterium]|jgi:hypothetical protein